MNDTVEFTDEADDPQAVAERATRTMYERDNTSSSLGMTLDHVAPGEARMSMTIREDMINGFGTCHGGYVFMLADSTFAFACNSHDKISVLAAAEMSFLAPVNLGDRLSAHAREVHLRGRSGIYDVEVRKADGEVVGLFRGKSRTVRGQVSALGDAAAERSGS